MQILDDEPMLDEEAVQGAMVEHYQGVNPYGEGGHGFDETPPELVWNGGPAHDPGGMDLGLGMMEQAAPGGAAMGMMPGNSGNDGQRKEMMRQMLYERLQQMGGNNAAYQER